MYVCSQTLDLTRSLSFLFFSFGTSPDQFFPRQDRVRLVDDMWIGNLE